jgi:hypothetical protein
MTTVAQSNPAPPREVSVTPLCALDFTRIIEMNTMPVFKA